MNDPLPSHDDRMPDWYDPFAEPRDLPAGWDLAGPVQPATRAPRAEAAPNRPAPKPAPPSQLVVTLN
jgi:hypothetical protein